MKQKLIVVIALLVIGLLWVQPTLAVPVNWTDWTSATTGAPGSATGTIGAITVNYTGDVTFAQTGSGTNYWTEYSPEPYTGNATVDNAPTAAEMVALSLSGITNTLTFSQQVTNPIMAIVSQGQPNLSVSYDFDASFTVLGEGRGYWGDGSYFTSPGDILTGNELHGVIQFNGTFSSISWTSSPNEYWHGVTVGLTTQAVPEPATMLLLGSGLAGIAVWRKRLGRREG